jgi:hypothetical protein
MDAQYDYVYGVYFGADSDKVYLLAIPSTKLADGRLMLN